MTDIAISNVVNISIASSNIGVNAYNTSNLALITSDLPLAPVQTIAFSGVAASGSFILQFGSQLTASIEWNASASTIQSDIQALSGLSNVVVSGSIASQTLTLTQPGQYGPIILATVQTNTLETSGDVAISITPTIVSTGWSGGAAGFSTYLSPTQVGIDFGTASRTYLMANGVFAQQPNILAGGGQLIIILREVGTQTITFGADPTGGAFSLEYNSITSVSLPYNATASQVQSALQALPGLGQCTVTGTIASEVLTVTGIYGSALITVPSNTLVIGTVPVTVTVASVATGESYSTTIANTQGLVQYFGVMPTDTITDMGQADVLLAAATILPLNLIGFFVSYNQADIQSGGTIALLASGNFHNSRGLYYGDSTVTGNNALVMMSSYAGLGLSVNFNGSNTTITMNLKSLLGVQPDPSMTQNIYNLAAACGADIYVSYQGDPAVVSNGLNKYFDQIYNLEWFVGALQVAGYNYLAQTATKIPQTEQGMDGLKGAYRNVCNQAVINQYSAPGTWTSGTTFGNQILFLQNIGQYGYYIYSQPIAQQLATARQARQSPLVQIALKEAGAIQSSQVIVYVNP